MANTRWFPAVLLLGLLPALWAPLQAQAADQSRLDAILARGTLKVGTTGDYKPFSFANPDTKAFEGLDIDMMESLGKALGVKVEFVKTAWPDMMADFTGDKFDVAAGGVSVSLARQKKGFFSIPYMVDGKTPIARCTDKDKFQTLADIDKPGVRAIVNPGGTNEAFARENLKAAEIDVYKDNVTIFDQIVQGKADVMITDASETMLQQKLHKELCSIHPDKAFNYAEKGYWLQPDPAFKDFVDQWLHLALMTGEYGRISDKWFK
ncbi:MAG TPA: transporter substrate-binding domain-containing protein [Stellaceae bacterium]|nr:transporter substrate-binding domain-containing protein [Stellaceae bacterium]